MEEILKILKNEIFIGYWGIVIEAIFLFFVWLEFKYIRQDQREKKDKEAGRQLNEIVRIFFRLYRWKAMANFEERDNLRSKYEHAVQNYKIARDAPGFLRV